jgi:hypothetical protein
MMVDWVAAKAKVFAATAAIFDRTECRMVPMARALGVNSAATVDGSRAEFPFLGTIDLQPSNDALPRHRSLDANVAGNSVAYDAVLTALSTEWPWRPRKADRMIAGGVTYEIAADEQDGSDRPAYYLNRIKA